MTVFVPTKPTVRDLLVHARARVRWKLWMFDLSATVIE